MVMAKGVFVTVVGVGIAGAVARVRVGWLEGAGREGAGGFVGVCNLR